MSAEKSTADRWEKNRAHWNETLDAQNLRESGAAMSLKTQLALTETGDVIEGIEHLKPLSDRVVLDLGGGLGLMAILLAMHGAEVVVADVSLPRIREAKRLVQSAGYDERIRFVQCLGEALPFQDQCFDGQITKSVLIHTDLAQSARELARTLSPAGRAAFIEPMTRNPFVNLYRALAAPRIWREITNYFTAKQIRMVQSPFEEDGRRASTAYRYFLAFFASPFNYTLGWPRLYRIAETILLGVDRAVFAVLPPLKKRAWFCIIKIRPRAGRG